LNVSILAAAAAEEVPLDDVPALVRETAERIAPGLDFYRVNREEEDGRIIYEFEAVGPRGEHMEIDVAEDGALEEIEMQIDSRDIPPAVRAGLVARFPGFVIAYVETSVRPNGVFTYEIEGQTAAGDIISVDIGEDGAILAVESAAMS